MPRIHFATVSLASRNAGDLRKALSSSGVDLTLTRARDVLASACGYRNFQELVVVTRTAAHPPTPLSDMHMDAARAASAFGLDREIVGRCMADLLRPSERRMLTTNPVLAAELSWIRGKIGMALAQVVRDGGTDLRIVADGNEADENAPRIGRERRLRIDADGCVRASSLVCTDFRPRHGAHVVAEIYRKHPSEWLSGMSAALSQGHPRKNSWEEDPYLDFDRPILAEEADPDDGTHEERAKVAKSLLTVYGLPSGNFDFLSLVGDAIDAAVPRRTLDLPFSPSHPVHVGKGEEEIRIVSDGEPDTIDFAEGIMEARPDDGRPWKVDQEIGDLLERDSANRPTIVCHGDEKAVRRFLAHRSRILGEKEDMVPPTVVADRRAAYLARYSLTNPIPGRNLNVTLVDVRTKGARLGIQTTRFATIRDAIRTNAIDPVWSLSRRTVSHPTALQATYPLECFPTTARGTRALQELAETARPTAILFMHFGRDPDRDQWFPSRIYGERIRDGIFRHAARIGSEAARLPIHPDDPVRFMRKPSWTDDIWRVWAMGEERGREPGSTRRRTAPLPVGAPSSLRVVLAFEVATLCPHCRLTEERSFRTPAEIGRLAARFDEVQRAGIRHLDPAGCEACGGTGKGDATMVVEILTPRRYRTLSGTGVPIVQDLVDLVLAGKVDPAPFVGMPGPTHW